MTDGKTKWLPILFDLYEKVNVFPKKDLIRFQMKNCEKDTTGSDAKKFNKAREAMLAILKENFQKIYPNKIK